MFPLQPFSLSFSAVFYPFSANDLISTPKLSVSDLSSAKCVGPEEWSESFFFCCTHAALPRLIATVITSPATTPPLSFGNMVGWAASCSGGICRAPDISVFFFRDTQGDDWREGKKKICFMISRLRRRVSGCVDSQISKENLQQNKQMRWPQSVKPWTSWETHFTLFWSRNIKSCWVWVLFWSCLREFMIDTPSVSVVPYLPQTQPV